MSNQWYPGSAGAQQWNTQTPAPYGQQNQNSGWAQGGGQWQPMQQAHGPPHQQPPYQQSFQGAPQFVPSRPQLPGQQAISGQLPQGQAPRSGFPRQNPQFQQPQQPMSQYAYIQEQQRLAREEQRMRDIEIQKRKLRTMNIAGATSTASSIDNLIGLSKLAELSPASQKRAAAQKTAPPTSQPQISKQTQLVNKPRAWTMDSSNFESVFAQRAPLVQQQDEGFGDFQSGEGVAGGLQGSHLQPLGTNTGSASGHLPGSKVTELSPQPYPQYVSGVGVNPTSSYTHPIPATSVSQITTHGGLSGVGGEQRTRALSSPYTPSIGSSYHPGPAQQPTPPGGHSQILPEANVPPPNQPASGRSGQVNPSSFPPIYMEVYTRCLDQDGSSLSTELLFPVLMSSQLPKSVLGELWQVANRGTPGKLNQTELFVLLGLVGLAQGGNPHPKFEDLQSVPSPPIPVLGALANQSSPAVSAAVKNTTQPLKGTRATPTTTPLADDFGSFQQGQLLSTSISTFDTSKTTSVSTFSASKSVPLSTSTSTKSTSKTVSASLSPSIISNSNSSVAPAGATPLPLSSQPPTVLPSTDPSDKYRVFSELLPNTDVTNVTSFDDFQSFISIPIQPEKVPTTSSTAHTSNLSGSNVGWADFSSMTVPTSSETVPSSLPEAPSLSAFSSLVPPEIKSKTVASVSPTKIEDKNSLKDLDSLASSQSFLNEGIKSGDLLTLDLFEPTSTKTPKPKKQLTGLDILNEEMTSRLLSSESNQQPVHSFDSQPLVPESLDEFGDFEAYSGESPKKGRKVNTGVNSQEELSDLDTNPPVVSSDPCKVWRTCLNKCSEVLESCASVFSAVEEKAFLNEIAQSEEGRNKLRGIAEVYRVASRVYFSLNEKDPAGVSADYTRNIHTQWSSLVSTLPDNVMSQLYSELPSANLEEEDVLSNTISKCSLCLIGKNVSITSLEGKHDSYYLPLLFHQGQSYHAGCANFWSNVVQEELPVLN